MSVKLDECKECYGKGKKWQMKHNKRLYLTCPVCHGTGRDATAGIMEKSVKYLTKNDEEKIAELITNPYIRNKEFSKKDALRDKAYRKISKENRDMSYEIVLDFMEDYLDEIRVGKLPEKSYFVFTPFKDTNKIFVANVIKSVYSIGYKPSKILNVQDIYSDYDKGNYEKIQIELQKDLVILDISTAFSVKNYNELGLDYVANYCGDNGIPLIVTSLKRDVGLKKAPDTNHLIIPSYIKQVAYKYDYGNLEYKGVSDKLSLSWYHANKIRKEAMSERESFSDLRKNLEKVEEE